MTVPASISSKACPTLFTDSNESKVGCAPASNSCARLLAKIISPLTF